MQFSFTDEQKLIRESVETACADMCDRAALFNAIENDNGFHKEAWTTLCVEMGLGLTAIPENYQGLGLGIIELASIMEKMGRVLLPTPFFTSIALSTTAFIKGKRSNEFEDVLSQIGSGEKIASFAFLDKNGQNSAERGYVKFKNGSVSGQVSFVQYGSVADYFVILAQNASGTPCLVVINAKEEGVTLTHHLSMDLTRPMSTLTLTNVPIISDTPLVEAADTIDNIIDIGRICLASEQLGASEAILEKTQSYVLERHQFGRAIGSFQAIKHRLADMMVLNEAAKSAAWYAACAADEMPEEISIAAATAMIVTSRALKRNSKNMIQLHGGMGFTWECEAHLYLKRAEMSSRYLGAETIHREMLAAIALGEI